MHLLKYRAVILVFLLVAMTNCTPPQPENPSASEGESEAVPEYEGEREGEPAAAGPEFFEYTVINAYPHDEAAFTQGLQYVDGVFYESTGLYGRSSLRRAVPETGQVLQQHDLDARYFGEGLTVVGDEIVQLTWRKNTAFVYDRDTFDLLRTYSYDTEGWGLTHDGAQFIMSDGSHRLYFRDTDTFEVDRMVAVHDRGNEVSNLNELEYIDGTVFANVWKSDYIVGIDPESGTVTAWIDLDGILDTMLPGKRPGVLNGIAYDAVGDRLFVTGKRWPRVYEIKLTP